jgi:hypothetical protein
MVQKVVIHLFLVGEEEIEFVESFEPTFVVPYFFIDCGSSSQGISLTKEAFQKVLGDYGNHFGKKIVNRCCFSGTIYSNCCDFDGT